MLSSLVDEADDPQDDLGREQQTADGKPAGQSRDPMAVEIEVALYPCACGPVCLGDFGHLAPVALAKQGRVTLGARPRGALGVLRPTSALSVDRELSRRYF